jgi:hypothetical protein
MRRERLRLKTFLDRFPISFINVYECAKWGFYYIGQDDKVQCFFCKGIVGQWELGDLPELEHRRHFRRCPLVLGIECGNISLEDEHVEKQDFLQVDNLSRIFNCMFKGVSTKNYVENKLEDELFKLRDKLSCKICLSNEADVLLFPCLHVLCSECINRVQTCPICCVKIASSLKFYRP